MLERLRIVDSGLITRNRNIRDEYVIWRGEYILLVQKKWAKWLKYLGSVTEKGKLDREINHRTQARWATGVSCNRWFTDELQPGFLNRW